MRALRWRAGVAMGGIVVCGILASALYPQHGNGQSQQNQPVRLPRPVVETHNLMELFNRPLYDLLRKEMQAELTNEEQFETIEQRGLQAAETANLVSMRPIPQEHQQHWHSLAADLQRAGLHLAEAARTQNAEATTRAYQGLIRSCNNCHQTMRPEHAPQLEP